MAVVWTLTLNGLLALAGWLAASRLEPPRDRPGRIWAAAILAATWLVLGMQLLGSLSLLGRGPLLAWTLLGLLIAGVLARGRCPDDADDAPPVGSGIVEGWAERLAAWFALGATLAAALMLCVHSLAYPVKVVSDGPIYHLYFAARWWKAHALGLVPVPFGESAAPYFPANGDLWFAWLMIGWGGDRLARVGQAPALLAAGWLVVRMARDLGATRSAAIVAACAFTTILPLLLFSFEANVDTLFTAAYLAGVYGLIRFDRGRRNLGTLALAGLALGLAWGCKPTGTIFVGPLAALVVLSLIPHHGLGSALLFLAATLCPVSYWFASNLLRTGNPLYPAHLEFAGRTWLTGWYQPAAMANSPYYLPVTDLAAFVDILSAVLDVRLIPLWCLALAGFWRLGRIRQPTDRWVWTLSALALLNLMLYWILIPYRTQQRFMLHSFGLAAIALARLLDRPWRVVAAASLVVVHLLTGPGWPTTTYGSRALWSLTDRIPQPLTAILPLIETPHASLPGPIRWSGYGIAWLAVGLGLAAIWLWGQPSRWHRLTALGATLLVLLGGVGWHELTSQALRRIYPADFPDYLPGWAVLETASPVQGTRVAYAGTDIPYYLFAGRMRNDVRYVNIDGHDDWLPHDYHREAIRRGLPPTWPDPRPSWERLWPDPDAWLANLRRHAIRLLVVARADPLRGRLNPYDNDFFPIERTWADSRPDQFRLLHADRHLRIYAVVAEHAPTDRRRKMH
ncbi:MAG: hypothetical protein KatS3mg108_3128 [Isosphaeraceae bacterium]|nr:MAG: hypothetical protein KatS3mg108_3128 [Isosphaeraceae bacterium]